MGTFCQKALDGSSIIRGGLISGGRGGGLMAGRWVYTRKGLKPRRGRG